MSGRKPNFLNNFLQTSIKVKQIECRKYNKINTLNDKLILNSQEKYAKKSI